MATTALVLAILFWPLGIVFGHIARHQIRRSGEGGAGRALAALIIAYLWGAVAIVLIASAIVAAHSGGFNNLTTLQKSVTQQLDANLQNASSGAYAPGTTVTSTLCVHQ
ncbi:MAG: DUF4190 domain-containing protein, partial [Mycobacteriales bacterium]